MPFVHAKPRRRPRLYVTLLIGGPPGKRARRELGWLMANTFLGPCPAGHRLAYLYGKGLVASLDAIAYVPAEGSRSRRGSKSHYAKITEDKVVDIRRRVHAGEKVAAVAAEYELTPRMIYNIVTGRSWAHVDAGVPLRGKVERKRPVYAKLTEELVRKIKARLAAGESPRSIREWVSETVPIGLQTIYNIEKGVAWRHVK